MSFTSFALIHLTEAIKEALDQGKYGCGIFVDLLKAFGTVDHNILLDKMKCYGNRGVAYSFFESYLIDRKQYVSISGFYSKCLPISNGVPQDSILGPLFFLIYISDLSTVIKDTRKENASSNKTEALTKIMNMYVREIGTLNQLFIRGSYTQIKFSKKKKKKIK